MVHARARFTPQMSFSKKLFIICFSNLNLTTHSEIDVSFKNLKQEIKYNLRRMSSYRLHLKKLPD